MELLVLHSEFRSLEGGERGKMSFKSLCIFLECKLSKCIRKGQNFFLIL